MSAPARTTVAQTLAVCGGNATAYTVVNSTPLLLGAILVSLKLDEATAGALLTLELILMGVAALATAPLLQGARSRLAAWIASGTLIVAEIAAAYSHSPSTLALALGALGIATGVLLAALNAIVAATAAPARLFGYAFMAAYGVAALLSFGLAPAIAAAGHTGAFATLAIFSGLMLPLLWWLPRTAEAVVPRGDAAPGVWRAGLWLLLGIAVIGLAMMGFYAYIERLGAARGLELEVIAWIFAAQQLASIAGAALAALLGERLGLARSIAIGTLLHTLAIAIAVFADSPIAFGIAVVAEGLTFLFMLPLLLTVAAALDARGRWAAAANGALFLSTGAAPWVFGVLIEATSYASIGWAMLAATPFGLWAFAHAQRCANAGAGR